MKIFFKAIIPIILFPFASLAQGNLIKVSGRLVSQKQALPDAAVALFNAKDSSIVNGDLSKTNGNFSIENVQVGNYYLRITAIGFAEKFVTDIKINEGDKEKKLGEISVDKSEASLKQVEIIKERPLFEMNIDKKVFNVDKNITTAGGTAADVLQNIPSVTVDASGNVSLRGKSNVTILIDGRPATLLGSDVASALQAMPAGSIQSVEVITNPSSKYDAQGKSGILNIVTKVNKNRGFTGNANLGIGTRGKYNGGLNMNYKQGKWNFSLNSNFRVKNIQQITETRRNNRFNDTGTYTYSDYQRQFNGLFNSFTTSYDWDTNNKISFTQNINLMKFGSNGLQEFNYFSNINQQNYNIQERYESFEGRPRSSSSNVNWKHKFKKPQQEITTDLTYSFSKIKLQQILNSNLLDGDRNVIYDNLLQEIPINSSNKNLNAQVDFTTPFIAKEGKLDMGLKTQNFWYQTNNSPTTTLSGQSPVEATFLRNQFEYYQQTHAAYASFSNKFKNWSYQVGTRLEYSGYIGTSFTPTTIEYKNGFLNLFPSAYLAYKIKEEQQVYFNYSRRIDRPYFRQLLPYLNIANALDTNSGNPNLKPEFIDNFELAYSIQLPKGNTILASVYYQHTTNLIQDFTQIYADGTSFTQPQNLSSGSTYGLELTSRVQIMKPWDATISANFFQNKFDGNNIDPSFNNDGFSWFSKLNTNYKLTKQISFQLMANYESAKPEVQGTRQEVYWFDAALKASFLKNNKASVTLNVSDLFNTRKYTTNYNLPLYQQQIYRNRETQIGTITFSYNFGNSDSRGDGGRMRRGKRNSGEQKKDLKERDDNIKSTDDDNNNG